MLECTHGNLEAFSLFEVLSDLAVFLHNSRLSNQSPKRPITMSYNATEVTSILATLDSQIRQAVISGTIKQLMVTIGTELVSDFTGIIQNLIVEVYRNL